jgi:hypothetical protein
VVLVSILTMALRHVQYAHEDFTVVAIQHHIHLLSQVVQRGSTLETPLVNASMGHIVILV